MWLLTTILLGIIAVIAIFLIVNLPFLLIESIYLKFFPEQNDNNSNKTQMQKVYAVGVMQVNLSNEKPFKHKRLWMLCANFERAEKIVLDNESDIFEGSYNFALIEEVNVIDFSHPSTEPNLFLVPSKQWWYCAEHDPENIDNNPWVFSIEVPEIFKNTFNWWVG